jgi:MFS superfamily sulfate permease-like transporter
MLLLSPKQEWLGNIRGDILAGIVVALALIPEAIAFSIIAAVIAFVGGRAGMISAATGAMALLMVTLVKEHGLQFADAFDYKEEVKNIVIDVTRAHFCDITAVYALDKAVIKLRSI